MDIQLTQGNKTFVDDVDADLAASKWHTWKGKNNKTCYAKRNVRRPDGTRTNVFLHQEIARRMGIVGNPDHIDRDGLNNRRSNLRPDPNGHNQANRGRQKNNTSGYKGVSWKNGKGKWVAQIQVDGKRRHLGYFEDPIEAAKAYDRAALQHQGEFAVLNFPQPR